MQQYILKRVMVLVPVILGVSILIFTIIRIVPGDMAIIILGEGAKPAEIAQLRTDLGLDRPLQVQYGEWVWNVLHGDFGISARTGRAVGPELVSRLPVTLELTLLAMIISLLVAIPLGVISAVRQDTWLDYAARLFSIGGLSVPEFWTGTLLLVMPMIWFNYVPNLRYVSLTEDLFGNLQQFMFPALAMGVAMSASVMRMTRSCLLEVLRQDYIRTAHAKGLRESVVVSRHALKNAMIPVITILGLQFGRLLGGTVVMERIFALPGVGRFVMESIIQRDYLMLQEVILLICVIFVFVNLLVDLTYAWLDPRIRLQ